jgi:hypothetical protein
MNNIEAEILSLSDVPSSYFKESSSSEKSHLEDDVLDNLDDDMIRNLINMKNIYYNTNITFHS